MTGCRYVASDQPRAVCTNDHKPREPMCEDCSPCPHRHCRVCRHAHGDGACPECMADTREALHDIAEMCAALPEEVEHRGVDGEAMHLLGPVANSEARGHLEASVLAGRVPPEYLETVVGELHPEFIAEQWGSVYREAFDHDEPVGRVTLADELGYLARNLTYMGTFEHVPFEDFARDLRRCRAHLQAVLHDAEHGERANVGCFDCGDDLERKLGKRGFEDHWTCRGCRRKYTIAEYNFALRAKLEEPAQLGESA